MIRLPTTFTNALVSLFRKDELISLPEIAVTLATFVFLWYLLPKLAAGGLASITNHESRDLASAAADHRPKPAFVPFFIDKWPHFICFQYIFGLGWQKRVFKFRIGFVFFLTRMPELDGSHQKCVEPLAYWSVHCRLTRSVLSALRCIHVSVREHRGFRSPYTSIADYRWHYDRFLPGFDYRNCDICRRLVLQSYSNYTTNHFNLTTTWNSSCPLVNILEICPGEIWILA